jgi:hypothetical protein
MLTNDSTGSSSSPATEAEPAKDCRRETGETNDPFRCMLLLPLRGRTAAVSAGGVYSSVFGDLRRKSCMLLLCDSGDSSENAGDMARGDLDRARVGFTAASMNSEIEDSRTTPRDGDCDRAKVVWTW